MKALEFIYQDTEIAFLLGTEKDVMVNATEMAKAFGKRTSDFLQNQSTIDFINEVELTLKSVNSDFKIYENRGKSGMYFERRLALKFAAWLDVKFEVWIYNVIDDILFGKAKDLGKKITETQKEKQKLSDLIEEAVKTNNKGALAIINQLEKVRRVTIEQKKGLATFKKQYTLFDEE